MSETGRQTFGLGRPLRDLLPMADEAAQRPIALFGEPELDEAGGTAALEAALAFCAAAMPDDLWGCSSWRPEGGPVTRIAGTAGASEAWALADVLRVAAADQLPASVRDGASVCLAMPAGPGAAIGLRRARRLLTPRESLFLQAVAGACVLAVADDGTTRRR